MMKKLLLIGSTLFLIICGTYLFIRFRYLKAKNFTPDVAKEKNIIDLRPSVIAKLQQLVQDASDGLYYLSVDSIDPHVLTSKINVFGGSVRIDSAALYKLDRLGQLPDDIFTIRFNSVFIAGMGLNDLLHTDRIDVKEIDIHDPVIHVYHKERSYNAGKRRQKQKLSMYEKLKGRLKKISIGGVKRSPQAQEVINNSELLFLNKQTNCIYCSKEVICSLVIESLGHWSLGH